ncbi:MAG: SGNH/GDSL hydrolase family protein [Verrucomicrobiota bacterium]
MRLTPLVLPAIGLLFCAAGAPVARALDVLFVGNSFTHGTVSPVSGFNAAAITDANGGGQGGVPGIFKALADEGGRSDVNVTIEAVSGQGLSYHLANKLPVIDTSWDVVVLQDYSTRPLSTHPSGDIAAFRSSVSDIADVLRAQNPDVQIFLYETWARPDQVPGVYASLAAMQAELNDAYFAAAADFSLAGAVGVGSAFIQALDTGVAYDPDAGAEAGKMNLWAPDNYHASAAGSYLASLMFYQAILGGDATALPDSTGSAATVLGLTETQAGALQNVASAAAIPEPGASAAIAATLVLGWVAARRRRV